MNRIPRAVYTQELRDEAVKLALTEGVGVSEASRRLSIPMKALANWVRAAKAGKLKDVGRHQKSLTEMEVELARVKRELAEVKMERDLLKKFATYCGHGKLAVPEWTHALCGTGKRSMNLVPALLLATSTVPRCSSIMDFTIARPNPAFFDDPCRTASIR